VSDAAPAPTLGLSGHAYVVTGATGALGRAVAGTLLLHGARIAVPYRSAERWREVERQLDAGDRAWAAAADITDPASTQQFVDEAARRLGRLDGVAAVAGAYAGSGPLEQAPVTEWLAMVAANLTPTFTICRAALPHLLKQGGSVVTVASRLAIEGGSGASAYIVSKAAVVALTRTLALENRERSVRFNSVAPGTIDTPANHAAMPGANAARWTSPAAIAEVIAFLLSPASAPVTGSVVPVDLPA
jgi:NAD(P)-dependent dehydrogenase (short-subunit alcohol dehydrogenase family)